MLPTKKDDPTKLDVSQLQQMSIADLSEAYSKSFKNLMVKAETSLIEAVRMDTPNFGMLNTGRGNLDASKSTISVLLLNLLDYFTAEWNMTQLEDCSEIIATDFSWLSQAEFKIFTLRCKKGHFGTDYGKLSPQRLLLWLEDFSQECRFERAGVEKLVSEDSTKAPQQSADFTICASAIIEKFTATIKAEDEARTLIASETSNERIRTSQERIQFRWNVLCQHRD